MVQGTAQSPKRRCLAISPILCLRVMRIMTQMKRHRHAQEFIFRFARELISEYDSIIKIYMASDGSKLPPPRRKIAIF